MSHAHHHQAYGHGPAATLVRLSVTLALVLVYMLAELVGGLLANSLALLADAGHMLSDAGALGLALFAHWFSRRPATPQHTYGYHRVEILAAFVNAAALIAVALFIFVEAIDRLRNPVTVAAPLMMAIATGGLVVNLISLWTLHGGRHDTLNMRGAWLHVLTDTLGSIQVLIAGALILAFGWRWADPLASAIIGLLIVYASWSLLRQSVAILMESAPGHVDVDAVRQRLMSVPGVSEVHDLHVWTISSGLVALSAHVCADRPPSQVLTELRRDLDEHFGIQHTTIEFDPTDPADVYQQPH